MYFPHANRGTRCVVCGVANSACGPPVGMRNDSEPKGISSMDLKRYRVKLPGNRGETTLRLSDEDASIYGEAVIGLEDEIVGPKPKRKSRVPNNK